MPGEAPSPYDTRGRRLVQHAAAFAASITGLIFGLGLGWSSAADAVQHGAQGMAISLEEWSWVTSLFCVGCAVGAVAVSRLVHSLGRRWVILAVGPVTMVAWALHLWASSVWMLYAGRVLVGMAAGASCVAAPIFVCEMSEPRIRGELSAYFEVLICLGILIVYTLGKLLSVFWLNVSCFAVSVLLVAAFLPFPDTPRWYVLRGREEDAGKALRFYRGPHFDVAAELALHRAAVKESDMTPSGWTALHSRVARKALAIATVLMIMQSITGVNAITFYASQLFTEAGTFDGPTASIVVAGVEVVAAVVSMQFVDRWGRRPLLLASGGVMAVCTGVLGGYFYCKEALGQDVYGISWLPIVAVCLYMFFFSVGWGPVVWVFVGEIFSDNIKGVGSAVCSASGFLASFLVTKFYPGLAADLGNYVTYWGFCVLCVLACVFVVLGVPETKGKTLDEVQAEL